jgi:hypothetical protein
MVRASRSSGFAASTLGAFAGGLSVALALARTAEAAAAGPAGDGGDDGALLRGGAGAMDELVAVTFGAAAVGAAALALLLRCSRCNVSAPARRGSGIASPRGGAGGARSGAAPGTAHNQLASRDHRRRNECHD